jgi:hypothetical protein
LTANLAMMINMVIRRSMLLIVWIQIGTRTPVLRITSPGSSIT